MYWLKPCGPVGHDAGDARARLSVVDAVPSAHHHLRSKLIGKANARLNVAPVRHIVCALLGAGKNFAAIQWNSDRLTGDGIGVGEAASV